MVNGVEKIGRDFGRVLVIVGALYIIFNVLFFFFPGWFISETYMHDGISLVKSLMDARDGIIADANFSQFYSVYFASAIPGLLMFILGRPVGPLLARIMVKIVV